MQRLQGYRINGSSSSEGIRPDIDVIVDRVVEIRREGSRDVDEFRGEFTIDEAQQLYVALSELLPKPVPDPTF